MRQALIVPIRWDWLNSPYPEEMNRNLTSRIAELHFAPTKQNKENLHRENIDKNVFVTGNTVIDSLRTTIQSDYHFHNKMFNTLPL